MIYQEAPTDGPMFAHDCDHCVYMGHYEGHDLYFCPQEAGGEGTVIARWSGNGPDYASGLPFGQIPLGSREKRPSKVVRLLRVAYLIAADLGYVPFVWGAMEVWPETCGPAGFKGGYGYKAPENHLTESIDNSEGKAARVIKRSLEVMTEVALLRNSHVQFTQSRKAQHHHASPGDSTPTIKRYGPTKAVLTVTYDEGELIIAKGKVAKEESK